MATDLEQRAVFGPKNPFFVVSGLPFEAPPFDRIKDEDFEPALLAGIDEELAEVRAIAEDASEATFENTVVAMERSGRLLSRVSAAFSAVAGANTNELIEQVQTAMAPRFAALSDAIYLDARLFGRVKSVWEKRDELGLDGESLRLLELTYEGFVHAGAELGEGEKARLRELNEEESKLTNAFNRKLLEATKAGGLLVADKEALAGLSGAQMAAAGAAAEARGKEGYWLALQNTTQQPVLAELSVRATRRALFERAWGRTERGDENDTRETVLRLVRVRAEKARLIGFETYAAWKLKDQMAKRPEAAIGFLDGLVMGAVAAVAREEREIQELMRTQGADFAVEAWDWEFYSEQVRKAKFDLDEAEIRPYFELNRVLVDGVFHAATRLFGIRFTQRYDLPVYHEDVSVYEVFNEEGAHLALFYFDPFKRDNKRGGAWMSSFVRQSRLLGRQPVIYNVSNIPKVAEGEAQLIRYSDVITLFHEFGHTLHGMFSEVTYPSLSGTSVPRDFVEFPSQFNEHWATDPEVFERYARHHETGKAMPEELREKMMRAEKFNQGYQLTELLAAAELDLEWHTLREEADPEDSGAFEQAALARKGLAVRAVPPRYRSSYFAHVFGGGYAAGYYAYLWSEMLEYAADEWFERNGGLTRSNGDRLRKMVLSQGNTAGPEGVFEAWLGGKPGIGAMLRARGLEQ